MMKTVKVTNTPGIAHLTSNASGRNRCVYEDKFMQAVDPDGTHVLLMKFPHNDVEIRTQWACKMKGTLRPTEIWLDVDFDAFDKVTVDVEVPCESR